MKYQCKYMYIIYRYTCVYVCINLMSYYNNRKHYDYKSPLKHVRRSTALCCLRMRRARTPQCAIAKEKVAIMQ